MLKNHLFWVAAATSLAIDQITKYWVIQALPIETSHAVWQGVFHFTHVINDGAAGSSFKGAFWLRWLSLAVSIFLIGLALWGPRLVKLEQLAYGLVLAGAMGNGIERFVLGYVTDFIDVRLIHFPIFNWADTSINLGIATYLLYVFMSSKRTA